jgi:hypothetical protein
MSSTTVHFCQHPYAMAMPLVEKLRKRLASIALHKSDITNSRVKILIGQKFNPDWVDNLSAAGSRYMESASERRSDRRLDPLFATQLLLEIAQGRR